MLKSLLLVYPHQQALSRSLTDSPPLGLPRGESASLESTQPFLISIIRGRESLTSVWCSEGLTWVPLIRSARAVSSCSTDGAEPNPPAQDSGLARLGSQSSLHSLNCHQGFSIGGGPSVVTCALAAGLRPLESSAKLP